MIKPLFTICLALGTCFANAAEKISLNCEWNFEGVMGKKTVNVPHDYLIEQPWVAPDASEKADNSDAGANIKSRLSARGFKELEDGTYTKTFTADAAWKGKVVLLDFEGVLYLADVYLNGEKVGGTDYGYLGFEIDVTRKLKYGESNELKVVCHQGSPKNSRWYTGGGLYRDVSILLKNSQLHFKRHPLHIRTIDNGLNTGTFGETVHVNITADVQCSTKQSAIKMQVDIIDAQGKIVKTETASLNRNRNYKFGQEMAFPEIEMNNPQLWDCEHPNLYTAKVTLFLEDGTVADVVEQTFGIRTVEVGPDYGLKLNGKKVLLKGNANHHTLGALGAAAYPRALEKRIQQLKEFGFNHIRTSHNPYSVSFLDLCDKYGILVVDELYDKWNDQYVGGGRAHFADLWMGHLEEFVKRDRNHPSIVMWSMGNELQSYNDMPFNDFGVTQFKLMKTLVQRYDPSLSEVGQPGRKVTVAMHPRYRNWETDSLPCDLAMNTDVQAYNYRYMYFPGDRKNFPWMTFYQSEANMSGMGPNFYEMELDKVIGLSYWGMIDYLGESGGWPAKGWTQGVFDIDLTPKPNAYFLKSMFTEEPTVHIGIIESGAKQFMWNGINVGGEGLSDHWNRTAGDKISLWTYTNADEVELIQNGKSLGTKKNEKADPKQRSRIKWDGITYQDGTLEAVAKTNGKVVARHKIETTGKAVALQIVADKPADPKKGTWKADGIDLEHLRVIAVDSKGRRVQTAMGDVKITLDKADGVASLLAMSSGNMKSDELSVVDHRILYKGSVLAILRAGTKPGTITVTASCEGMKPAKIKLTTK